MRTLPVLCAILLFSVLAFSQNIGRGHYPYGWGPYVPLITTPSVSFQTISPNPVGATNATGGLIAGATNSTLSMVSANPNAVYTLPLWYSGGGTPLISPAVNSPLHAMRMEPMERMETAHHERETARRAWTYLSSLEQTASPTAAASAAKGGKKAARTYSNQDVERQNQKNGMVKYDNKTEKIQ